MINNSGIIFADIFISNKDMFVDIFEQYYLKNAQELDKVITQLNNVLKDYTSKQITESMASAFQISWKEFQQKVLLNQTDLQLIVAYRGQGGRDGQFSQIIKQSDVEKVVDGKYGIDSGNRLIKDSMQALKAQKIEYFLQTHLNGFLNQLETPISQDEAIKIYKYHSEFLHSIFKENDHPSIVGQRWRVPFYGGKSSHYFSGQGLGQAYDAFMNHLANHNKQIYDYLAQRGLISSTLINPQEKGSVFEEEGGVEEYGSFPYLLNQSKNHTGWYTGGDIIIVNPQTMGVVYNIQLKTTTANKPSVFGERVEAIRKFIQSLMNMTPRQKGEKIFNFLLTSVSNRQDFNTLPQQTIDNLVKENLKTKINFSF